MVLDQRRRPAGTEGGGRQRRHVTKQLAIFLPGPHAALVDENLNRAGWLTPRPFTTARSRMHEAGPHFAGVRRESGGKTVIDAKADLPCAPFGLQHGPRSILFAGRVGRDPPQVGDRHTRGVPAINPFHAGAELAVMQMQDLTMPRRRSWLSKATTLEFTFV